MLPFPEYRPDISDFRANATQTALNVVPRADGYGPFNALAPFTAALPDTCRGYFFAHNNDGSVSIFAGTATKLYKLDNTDQTWTDVSKSAGTYSALSGDAHWQFAQFTKYVVAVQQNAPPQVFDLTSSTAFDDLGGSPPQAAYVSVVNRFLVLSGIKSPDVYRIQWSDIDDITEWSSGQADFQDFPDGGIVRGVAGGETGVILQDQSIRRMTYAPGSPYVFGIERISSNDGLYAPYSLVTAGDRIFFCSPQGFKMMLPGAYPVPIGKEKVDRTFFENVDTDNLQLMIAATDSRKTRVYWTYKSINGGSGRFDTILCYDWALDRWSSILLSGEYIAALSQPGLTLESIDNAFGSDIDALDISLDNFSSASLPKLSACDGSHKVGFFIGDTLEARLATAEQGQELKRIFVRGFRPVTDAQSVFGSLACRERTSDAVTTTTETSLDARGYISQRRSTRFARGIIRIPAATDWTFASGIEPDVGGGGMQ